MENSAVVHIERLCRVRNEFAHDDPDTVEERFERLQLALRAASSP
jgi:hypothetical protein